MGRRNVGWLVGAVAVGLGGLLGPVVVAGAEAPAEPVCGAPAADGSAAVRANLEASGGPVTIRLGRKDGGAVQREVTLTWADGCTLDETALAKLAAIEGVLSSTDASLPTSKVTVKATDTDDKTLTVVLTVERDAVDPGKYEGTITLRAPASGPAAIRGQIPVVLQRQESITGPHGYWSPLLLLVVAIAAGLVFGWWRATALAGTEQDVSFFAQRYWAPRNVVAFIGAAGAGIAAWSVNYLRTPDYRFDAEAVMSLFVLVAGPVATTLLTFIKPVETTNEPVVEQGTTDRGAEGRTVAAT